MGRDSLPYAIGGQRTVLKRYSFFSNPNSEGEDERSEIPMTLESLITILKLIPRERSPQQIQFVQVYTKNVSFFQKLAKEEGEYAHKQCCLALLYESYDSGQYVFHQGDDGDRFYIMLEGVCGVIITNDRGSQEVRTYEAGGSFGELALLKNQPRAAGIICKSKCHFAVLHRDDYCRTVQRLHRKKLEEKVDFLLSQPMFKCWTKGSMTKLSYYFFERTFMRKQIVYKAGDPSNEIYLIREGEFRLLKEIPPKKKDLLSSSEGQRLLNEQQDKLKARNFVEVASMTKGEMFGIEELFDGGPRTSSCMCYTGEAEAYAISREDFFKRVKNEEKLAQVRSLITARDSLRTQRLQNRSNLNGLLALRRDPERAADSQPKTMMTLPDHPSLSPLPTDSQDGSRTERAMKRSSTWDRILKRNFEKSERRKCRDEDEVVNIHTQGRRRAWVRQELEGLQSLMKMDSGRSSPRFTLGNCRTAVMTPVMLTPVLSVNSPPLKSQKASKKPAAPVPDRLVSLPDGVTCSACDKILKNKNGLSRHMSKVHHQKLADHMEVDDTPATDQDKRNGLTVNEHFEETQKLMNSLTTGTDIIGAVENGITCNVCLVKVEKSTFGGHLGAHVEAARLQLTYLGQVLDKTAESVKAMQNAE